MDTINVRGKKLPITIYLKDGLYTASYSNRLNAIASSVKLAKTALSNEMHTFMNKGKQNYCKLSTIEKLEYDNIAAQVNS
jgi:hypothetical protein